MVFSTTVNESTGNPNFRCMVLAEESFATGVPELFAPAAGEELQPFDKKQAAAVISIVATSKNNRWFWGFMRMSFCRIKFNILHFG